MIIQVLNYGVDKNSIENCNLSSYHLVMGKTASRILPNNVIISKHRLLYGNPLKIRCLKS